MSSIEEYDVVVLGSGEGGRFIAWSQGSQGKRTIVIERRYVGGSCPNIACLPSKKVIHSAKVADLFRRASEFGIDPGHWKVEMRSVRDRKRKMVDGLVAAHRERDRVNSVELLMGQGRFVAPKTIEVATAEGATRTLHGHVVVISTGSRPNIDLAAGLAVARPMTHVEALELDYIPDHLVVIGGGYVGLEFAQAMRRFGSRVTIVEKNNALIHREDRDVSDALRELLNDDGIDVHTGTRIHRVEGRSGESVRLHVTSDCVDRIIDGSDLLVASGKTPNTEDIGLESAGVERVHQGFVKVDERLRTSAPGVWAVGECAGSPQFTHIAYDDFRVVRDNLAGLDRVTTDRLTPWCLFTDPELARVGLSESEAQSRGTNYRLIKLPVSSIGRALTLSAPRGFYKALIATDSDHILGFTAFAPHAGEVMAIVQVAMIAGLPYTELRESIMTHPTMAEGLVALFRGVPSRT
jgi:pyruvate/2-oxoglutarate dehydrogenase complex dihydrolipoamide dehydrogenase (E3) component